mmetsp:Transcript_16870/g.16531  ORF Transcript_16870/g.16531 Transcript_16870/m.16531 type:complete len:98 (+) Transcript_16870:33-326(+)|eukprot:CAMPEP_0196999006 /NCGR_PEP_ID=MMETSP1380-20130617/4274_1 /TAXON_ID=5936 /ORGANISM="Euplotes crassus, Strain CT5" /LENGTH=97 /DNA_ID=CAMNT_0042415789 /DNA_START=28 /DNA_END=321 /DNA_ORIENTATION=+
MIKKTRGSAVRRPSPSSSEGDTLVEKQMQKDNNAQIGVLAQNISSIKKLSKSITSTLKDEESLMNDLEDGFGKSDTMMNHTMGKLNELMNSSGGNVL